eukprot:1076775-Alexandrium_andersonii.AAC.1
MVRDRGWVRLRAPPEADSRRPREPGLGCAALAAHCSVSRFRGPRQGDPAQACHSRGPRWECVTPEV